MTNSTELSRQALVIKAKREKARRHLADFANYVYDGYKSNWHTNLICHALELVENGTIRYLLLEAPPRHSKSLHVSQLFPAWAVGRDKDRSIIVSSYSGDLATSQGRETRKIMETVDYKNIFDTRLASDSNAKGKWNTQGKGAYNAVGVGGSVTGKGADFFIVDDSIKDRKEADSVLMRDNVWNFFRSVATTRLTPKGAMIIMQTRWHEDDIIGRITEGKDTKEPWIDYFDFLKNGLGDAKWVRLTLPAIALKDDDYRKEGEALWPGHFPLEELESKKKSLGGYEWSALYQQIPIDEENRIFKKQWFKYRTLDEVLAMRTANFMTVDTKATKEAKDGTDYIGFTINYVDKDGFWNLLSWRKKLSSKELVDFLFTAHSNHKLLKIGIEKTAYVEGLQVYLDEEQRRRNHYLPIVEISHGGTKKEIRIESGLQPRYENGAIFHIMQHDKNQCADLEEELIQFPKAVNDDASDSAAYQSQVVQYVVEPEEDELLSIY